MDVVLRMLSRSLRATLGLGALTQSACAYDFADCDYEWVQRLPESDPHDVKTGAYLYELDWMSKASCLSCDADCRIDIETAFAYEHPPRSMDVMCGPMWLDGVCAAAVSITDPPDDSAAEAGRPFRVEGVARLAPLAMGGGWADTAGMPEIPVALRSHVAAHWARQALVEHASIASFARAILQLLHLGAPEELVEAAAQALADEVDHARRAFSIASAATERELGPGRLDVAEQSPVLDLHGVIRAAFVEGCVNETIGAAKAHLAAAEASDPAVHLTLAKIASDETRHAALAWRVVRWGLTRDPSVAVVLVTALAEAEPTPPAVDAELPPELSAWGVVPPAEGHALALRVFREIVRPTLGALLASRADAHA